MANLSKRKQELRKENSHIQQELGRKIKISHPQIVLYENKSVQLLAEVLTKIADVFDVSIDYLVNSNRTNEVEQIIKDAEVIKQFKQLAHLKKSILKIVGAMILDFKTKQAYTILKQKVSIK